MGGSAAIQSRPAALPAADHSVRRSSRGMTIVKAMPESPAVLVRAFHEAFDLPRQDRPSVVAAEVAAERQRLLLEEVSELSDAVGAGHLAEIAQELADVVYVAYGTALAYGVDLDAVVGEVHRANMSKLGLDGHPAVRNGKVVKGPGFQPPDVAAVIGQVRD
jgi:predicted HAD superfamily Cof-like phosphohydrolase